jgi:hypothetical protein
VHIDIAEVRTEEGKLFLFIAIDRTSKIAFAKLSWNRILSSPAPRQDYSNRMVLGTN